MRRSCRMLSAVAAVAAFVAPRAVAAYGCWWEDAGNAATAKQAAVTTTRCGPVEGTSNTTVLGDTPVPVEPPAAARAVPVWADGVAPGAGVGGAGRWAWVAAAAAAAAAACVAALALVSGRHLITKLTFLLRPLGAGMVVTDPALARKLQGVAVHKADQHYTLVFSGGHANSILSSVDGDWDRQRRMIHRFIAGRAAKFAAATRRAAEAVRSDPAHDGVVEMLEWVGRRVAAVSAAGLGVGDSLDDGGADMSGDVFGAFPTLDKLISLAAVMDLSRSAWLIGGAVRRITAHYCRRTQHDRLLHAYVRSAQHECPFIGDLVAEFGEEEALGHLWSMTLGSTIPEAVIICRVLEELAGDEPAQRRVRALLGGDDVDSVRGNAPYMAWVQRKCTQYMFFVASYKRVAQDAEVTHDGRRHRLTKGEVVVFDYRGMYGATGESFAFGFGRRQCPGAAIGRGVVAVMVYAVLSRYHLTPNPAGQDRGNWCRKYHVRFTPL